MDPGRAGQPNPSGQPLLDNHDSFSSSATSDSSDGDDFFQIDPLSLGHPMPPSEKLPPLGVSHPTSPHQLIPHPPLQLPTESNALGTASHSPSQGQPTEFRSSTPPPLPPLNPNNIPDPNRIPSSIFMRTKSNSPMDWSVASNESLFSIHMGNASFSRDNFSVTGKSAETNSYAGSPYEGYPTPPLSPMSSSPFPQSLPPPVFASPPVLPLPPPPSDPPPPPASSTQRTVPEQPGAVIACNAEAMAAVVKTTPKEQELEKHYSEKEKAAADERNLAESISRQSEGSTASFQSFAFPM